MIAKDSITQIGRMIKEVGGSVRAAESDGEFRLSFLFPDGTDPELKALLMRGMTEAADLYHREKGGNGLVPTAETWAELLTMEIDRDNFLGSSHEKT